MTQNSGSNGIVLVCDVLDTLVADPFYTTMHKHFGFDTHEQFLQAKAPDVWLDFELGKISEAQFAQTFFKSNRSVDLPLFKRFLKDSFHLLPGISQLLISLRKSQIPVHLCSNYPPWSHIIEEAVGLSSTYGAIWTFVSGEEGLRKPDLEAYQRVATKAGVDISKCIFLDDRKKNCDAALLAGYMGAVQFINADQTYNDLVDLFVKNGVQDFNNDK